MRMADCLIKIKLILLAVLILPSEPKNQYWFTNISVEGTFIKLLSSPYHPFTTTVLIFSIFDCRCRKQEKIKN